MKVLLKWYEIYYNIYACSWKYYDIVVVSHYSANEISKYFYNTYSTSIEIFYGNRLNRSVNLVNDRIDTMARWYVLFIATVQSIKGF